MKNLKTLSRKQLSKILGGASCAHTCSDGSFIYISSCTKCMEYQGDGVACYDSKEKAMHVATC